MIQPASLSHRLIPPLLIAAHLLFNRNIVIPVDMTKPRLSPSEKNNAVVIAQVTDLHFNQRITRPHRRAARAINRLSPDILLITGDSVNNSDAQETLKKWLAGIEGPENQIYAVLGNWEYNILNPRTRMKETYVQSGVQLLVNNSVETEVGGRHFRITGLDDGIYGNVDYSVCGGADAAATELIMIHEPGLADGIAGRTTGATIFAGHTHGGQIRILGTVPIKPRASGDYIEGAYQVASNRLIVSRGIGTSSLPIRMGPEPDIRILRFRAGE